MKSKKIRYNLNLIRVRHSYFISELSELLHIHPRTVQSWHKNGMSAIDENDRPYLFLGQAVKDYLLKRKKSRKVDLEPGQFYCFRCHKAVWPKADSLTFDFTNRIMGKGDKQVIVKALCEHCSLDLRFFSTHRNLSKGFWAEKFKEAEKRLYSNH